MLSTMLMEKVRGRDRDDRRDRAKTSRKLEIFFMCLESKGGSLSEVHRI